MQSKTLISRCHRQGSVHVSSVPECAATLEGLPGRSRHRSSEVRRPTHQARTMHCWNTQGWMHVKAALRCAVAVKLEGRNDSFRFLDHLNPKCPERPPASLSCSCCALRIVPEGFNAREPAGIVRLKPQALCIWAGNMHRDRW